jgi:predicted nucleic acid-binding protein
MGVADAAHLAFTEDSADFFISCDDKLIKKCKKLDINLTVMNPVQFTVKEDLK